MEPISGQRYGAFAIKHIAVNDYHNTPVSKKLRHIIGLFFGNRLIILSGEDNPNYKGVKPPKLAFCIILPFSDEKTRITRAYSLQNENFG
ncbi:MAG: hypothetical protein IJT84_06480 [Clostridia bacterium]|nr:hypothetical protein [Clostridia bacterium]